MKYKQHLKAIVTKKIVLEKATLLQAKLNTNSITSNDFKQINELDALLTSGMLKTEHMLVITDLQYPLFPYSSH